MISSALSRSNYPLTWHLGHLAASAGMLQPVEEVGLVQLDDGWWLAIGFIGTQPCLPLALKTSP